MRGIAQRVKAALADPVESTVGTSRFEEEEKERGIPPGPRSGCSSSLREICLHPGPVFLCSRSSLLHPGCVPLCSL